MLRRFTPTGKRADIAKNVAQMQRVIVCFARELMQTAGSTTTRAQTHVITPVVWSARGEPSSLSPLCKSEGMERRMALQFKDPPFGRDALCESAFAIRRSTLRRFLSPEPYFRVGADALSAAYPAGFGRPSAPPRPAIEGSPSWWVRTVDRSLPGAGCEPARGRRARPKPVTGPEPPGRPPHLRPAVLPGCSTSGSPHEASPREQAKRNIHQYI